MRDAERTGDDGRAARQRQGEPRTGRAAQARRPHRTGRLEEAAGARLAAAVTREMGRAEALLKVVGSRPENLADNFFTLLPAATPADFQRIVDLKARALRAPHAPRPPRLRRPGGGRRGAPRQVMRRPEQQAVLDAFNRRLGRPGAGGALRPAAAAAAAAAAGAPGAGANAQAGALPAAPPRGAGATQELMARFRRARIARTRRPPRSACAQLR